MSADTRTIAELARALRARETSAEIVTRACLARIDERNPAVHAFITVLTDQAIAAAVDAAREMSRLASRSR